MTEQSRSLQPDPVLVRRRLPRRPHAYGAIARYVIYGQLEQRLAFSLGE